GMAQTFVGANNVNLLHPSGQFGTRLLGGKDAASPRYIFTYLSPVTRTLFPVEDDSLLESRNDDGQWVEPRHYLPILPLVLVNGADGIGTGYRSQVPNYNPREIVANLRRKLHGEPLQPLYPWYKGFTGRIDCNNNNNNGSKCTVSGIAIKTSPTTVSITELPVGTWTTDYRENVLD